MNELLLIFAITLSQFIPAITDEDCVLYQIMMVESGGREIRVHPDKKSFGFFGLTEVACKEVGEEWPPTDELATARKYLRLMCVRHNIFDLYDAAGFYHGGNKERRDGYIAKVQAVEPEKESAKTFAALLAKEKKNGDGCVKTD